MASPWTKTLKERYDRTVGNIPPSGVLNITSDQISDPSTIYGVVAGNKLLNIQDSSTSVSKGTPIYNDTSSNFNDMLNNREQWLADRGYDINGYPLNNSSSNMASGSYNKPSAIGDYNWGDGSQYLTPDNPLVRPVVYNNEFSPASTMSIASDVYNEYYSPIVQEQQRQTTQAYRDSAEEATAVAGAAGMATGSRGAIQLANQANREATAANLQYQQQMQLQAFQDTLNARQLELENKIQDYQNAWQEVSQYGYVVTENTGNLLGIQPGQQLTTYAYKQAMSDIATNVANINAQKVQLNQQQQQLDMDWAEFQESIRQYEKTFAEQQRQFNLGYDLDKQQADSSIYSRLVDMLGRYDTVTQEMANLGAQVGMNLTVGSSTANYLTEAERYANNEAAIGNQQYYNTIQQQNLANSYLQAIQSTGKIGNASQFAALLAQWKTQGVSPNQAMNYIDNKDYMVGDNLTMNDVLGNVKGSKDAAKALAYQILGGTQDQYNRYNTSSALNQLKGYGQLAYGFAPGLFGLPYSLLNSYMYANNY